jgi:hypothetical protein
MNLAAAPGVQHHMFAKPDHAAPRILAWIGAAALVVSGLVHLHLWDIAYRHVDTLGPLFLVQGIVALVLAVVLVAWTRPVVALAGLVFAAGTIAGYVKALNGGIFGFTLPVVTGWANLALTAEIVALVALGSASWLMLARRPMRNPAPAPTPSGA